MGNIAFIVGSASSPSSSRDIPIRDLLVANSHTVTYVDDSDTPAAGSYDMLIISESASTSNAQAWHDVDLPIITTEILLEDQGYGSASSSSGAGDETGKVNLAHYITDDHNLNDEFEYVDPGDDRGYVTGWANDVKALLVVANNTTRALILSIEDGDTDANGDTAINRRVMFTHPRAGEWTTDGENIFLRCVDWCLGLDAGGTNYVENLSGAIADGGQLTAPQAMAESFTESMQNTGNLSGAAALTESLSAAFVNNGNVADGFLIIENLTGLIANAGQITAIAAFAENVSGAASAAGTLAGNAQMQESIAAASRLTGAIIAGIDYLESLSGSTANTGLIADLRGFYENLLAETASSGTLSAFAGLVENLQGLTANAFNIAATQQGAEMLAGISAALGNISDALQSVQPLTSRITFYRKYNLSFIYPPKPAFCWDRKRSFAA